MLNEKYLHAVQGWWEQLSTRSRNRGTIAGALVLAENLRSTTEFDIEGHKTAGSDQLRNATLSNVQNILARHGETRVLHKEGGRTNRGLMRNLEPLLFSIADAGMVDLSPDQRAIVVESIQAFLTERARDIFNRNKISFAYDTGMSSRDIIGRILDAGSDRQQSGEIAEYLVGAKLALRFPGYEIRNSSASAADAQASEQGDFQINDCVFHVTVSPNSGHYKKCQQNLNDGLRVFLLVPDARLLGARQRTEQEVGDHVSVESIESFVSQNIEELGEFASLKVARQMKQLLDTYNQRVQEVETDLSLMISIPQALAQ